MLKEKKKGYTQNACASERRVNPLYAIAGLES